MSVGGPNFVPSSYDHVPRGLGWQINVPELAHHTGKFEYVRLALSHAAVVVEFVEGEIDTQYETQDYDSKQTTGLSKAPLTHLNYYGPKPSGFLMGFPVLKDVETEQTLLGVEICGNPNDIYGDNIVFRMMDILRFGRAPREQADALYKLENELANGTTDDETEFMHASPIAIFGEHSTPLRRPMSGEERERLRADLPFSFEYFRPQELKSITQQVL